MHSGEMSPDNLTRAAELELPLLDKLRLDDETLLEIGRLRTKSLSVSPTGDPVREFAFYARSRS